MRSMRTLLSSILSSILSILLIRACRFTSSCKALAKAGSHTVCHHSGSSRFPVPKRSSARNLSISTMIGAIPLCASLIRSRSSLRPDWTCRLLLSSRSHAEIGFVAAEWGAQNKAATRVRINVVVILFIDQTIAGRPVSRVPRFLFRPYHRFRHRRSYRRHFCRLRRLRRRRRRLLHDPLG
jgi:hypothetical protein